MEKEFVPYNLSLRLKELGFDEPCFGYYDGNHNFNYMFEGKPENFSYRKFPLGHSVGWKSAPTFSQAFRWFREKCNLKGFISPVEYLDGTDDTYHWCVYNHCNSGNDRLTYEEAELECLKKLIEIVESQNI